MKNLFNSSGYCKCTHFLAIYSLPYQLNLESVLPMVGRKEEKKKKKESERETGEERWLPHLL